MQVCDDNITASRDSKTAKYTIKLRWTVRCTALKATQLLAKGQLFLLPLTKTLQFEVFAFRCWISLNYFCRKDWKSPRVPTSTFIPVNIEKKVNESQDPKSKYNRLFLAKRLASLVLITHFFCQHGMTLLAYTQYTANRLVRITRHKYFVTSQKIQRLTTFCY